MAVSPADEYRHACDTIDEQAVTIAGLLEQVDELTGNADQWADFAKLAAKRHAAAELAVKVCQGARDDDWADLCATRRVWAEVVRLVEQIDGST